MLKSPRILRFVLIFIVFVIFLSSGLAYFKPSTARLSVQAANATLGFGGIYVVSGPGSPRRNHLQQAAAVTELEITIPEQVGWTEEDILNFRVANVSESHIGEGSIRAWLSHHLALRAFLASGQETALILEDDVDFDIRLRAQQVPLTQRAARQLLQAKDAKAYPWSETSQWDLLYLGHCGDYWNPVDRGIGVGFHHPEHLDAIPHIVFSDQTVSPYTDLHPYTASLFVAFGIPAKNRILHRSKFPLCTFGYAVTRWAAQTLLTEVAPAAEERIGGVRAYDVAILDGCTSKGILRCYSIQPELFHHMSGESIISAIEDNPHRPPVDVKGSDQVVYRKETSNIDCGFFSGDFYYDGDTNKLKELRKDAKEGQCKKPMRTG